MTTPGLNGHRLGASFINAMGAEALDSAAVDHPYLQAMRGGDFPNLESALRDFAFQYGLYSANFTRYVSAVIRGLSDDRHKEILRSNLAEEHGETHDIELPPDVLASVVGQPHTRLYRRFQEALGLDVDSIEPTSQCPGLVWSQQFLELCETDECVGIGAIGMGTELIVSRIYDQILEGLKMHSDLTATERVFFDLHCECDDKHAAEILSITEDLSQDQANCERVEHGIRSALRLRAEFWDRMLERARKFPAPASA